jgi:hypothetical protein
MDVKLLKLRGQGLVISTSMNLKKLSASVSVEASEPIFSAGNRSKNTIKSARGPARVAARPALTKSTHD